MDRREKILKYIKSEYYIPLKLSELRTILDVPKDEINDLQYILDELCKEGKIFQNKKGRYVPSSSKELTGVLECSVKGGFGFFKPDDLGESELFIPVENMGCALHGDRVAVVATKRRSRIGLKIGRVERVVEAGNKIIVGVVKKRRNDYFITPDNKSIFADFYFSHKDYNEILCGERVSADICGYRNGRFYTSNLKKLGDGNDLKSYVAGQVLQNGITSEFGDNVNYELSVISKFDTQEVLETENRVDLRDKKIFTIDGQDARDFDDAVSIEKLDNNNVRIGVHIADVSYFVKENGECDTEAYERGTSVYLPDRVIPMLPEKLSNGLCSLVPNADRLTVSVFMDVNDSGEIVNSSICKSVIKSCARLVYEDVNKLLNGDDNQKVVYKDIYDELVLMNKYARILRSQRARNGAMELDLSECQIVMSNSGKPKEIIQREKGPANQLIEEFMIATNVTVARFAFENELPFIYRVHDCPTYEKYESFRTFIKGFGLEMEDCGENIDSKQFVKLIDSVKNTPIEDLVTKNVVRSMMKAQYSPNCTGHFGLAIDKYCHFTSPIRRYPDLVIHRIIKKKISGNTNVCDEWIKTISQIAKKSTECEWRAQQLERNVDDVMKAYYMEQYVGESFKGVISGVFEYGIFVELENTVEGLVHIEMLTDDFYIYDEEKSMLKGKRLGREYRLGDEIEVTVVCSDYTTGRVDFVITDDMSFEKWNRYRTKRDNSKAMHDGIKKKKRKRARRR